MELVTGIAVLIVLGVRSIYQQGKRLEQISKNRLRS